MEKHFQNHEAVFLVRHKPLDISQLFHITKEQNLTVDVCAHFSKFTYIVRTLQYRMFQELTLNHFWTSSTREY